MIQISIPKGTRDFSPETLRKRHYIMNIIKNVFEKYAFEPLETPAMENIETLTGKYGDEGDKLMFRVLDNGEIIEHLKPKETIELETINKKEFIDEISSNPSTELKIGLSKEGDIVIENPNQSQKEFYQVLSGALDKMLGSSKQLGAAVSEKALRYDLTIPFARFVVMNRNNLVFPFRRYQMQPVWRADRPQKGRFREFYQCDADVVGSKSLILEIELLNIYREVFEKVGLKNFELRLNNRKILAGLAQLIGATDKMMDMTIAIDKLDKVGIEGVQTELQKNNFDEEQIKKIVEFLSLKGTTEERFTQLKNIFADNEEALKGVKELFFVMKQTETLCPNASLVLDLTLARGLNYYTGIIIEVKAKDVQMGSIGGGGRYDDLTGVFGLPNVSGVGISFGLDRIYEVMDELKLFPDNLQTGVQVLFINFGNEPEMYAFQQVQKLRTKDIVAELYPSNDKIKKQMEYAHRKKVPFVVLIGEEEMKTQKFQLKNMETGEQQALSLNEIIVAIEK